jgi:mannose/cellobiose epimerase-like protein (N-acyl-D-glucosamine 2-epimerase family)
MTYAFAIGSLLGDRPRDGTLADHGLAALAGRLRDGSHGGWFLSSAGPGGDTAKDAYTHVFVFSPPRRRASPVGQGQVLCSPRPWRSSSGASSTRARDCSSTPWDRNWSTADPYRGANANMHAVEAFLAAADATGEDVWRRRALTIAEHLVHGEARANGWRMPEHYDERWQPVREYNADDPSHKFRPYGVTPGHLLEWSRLCVQLSAALGPAAPGWLLEDATALFDQGVKDGWHVDGAPGFVYTVDWQGRPVVRSRMHWVLAEGIGAAALLHRAVGGERFERLYEEWWAYAAAYVIDRDLGSWRHELDEQNRLAGTTWPGKPDVYHALGALLLPVLPLDVSPAAGLGRRVSRRAVLTPQ